MSHGYAGLSKRRKNPEAFEAATAAGVARKPSKYSQVRVSTLHIVEVDRRLPGRFDIADFGVIPEVKKRHYPSFKRFFDVIGASIAILLFTPLIIAIVLCSWAGGVSPLFRHRRVGLDGVVFDCLKFRTMVRDADKVLERLLNSNHQCKEEWLLHHKLKDDPRITRVGRFLRRSSLDELPQLLNVLRGDMSLVGPRPVVPDELRRYGTKASAYLATRPGITGLWQVSGRNNVDYRRRVALDVCYVRSQSIGLDLYILMKTLPAVFATDGAY